MQPTAARASTRGPHAGSVALPILDVSGSPAPLRCAKTRNDVESVGALKFLSIEPSTTGKLGFSFAGGVDNPLGGAFVQLVNDDRLVDLHPGDRILAVNDRGVLTRTKAEVASLIDRSSAAKMKLTVLDSEAGNWQHIQAETYKTMMSFNDTNYVRSIKINPPANLSHLLGTRGPIKVVNITKPTATSRLGLGISGGADHDLGGVFVTSLDPSGLAYECGQLKV